MALFKSLRGKRENLPTTKTDGYAYFCTDDGTFHIDYIDDNGVIQRKQINAKDAETLSSYGIDQFLLLSEQTLNETQQTQARTNIDAASATEVEDALGAYINDIDSIIGAGDIIPTETPYVMYTPQTLTTEQMENARLNINAVSADEVSTMISDIASIDHDHSGVYSAVKIVRW